MAERMRKTFFIAARDVDDAINNVYGYQIHDTFGDCQDQIIADSLFGNVPFEMEVTIKECQDTTAIKST